MKITKLNARGFSHDLLLIAIVVVVAISGVAFLVGTHANSLNAKTVSSVSSVSTRLKGKCSIKLAHNPKEGTQVNPTITVYNTGKKAFVPHLVSELSWGNRNQPNQKGGGGTVQSFDTVNVK